MPLEQLSLETLKTLDGGRVGAAFRRALRLLEEDCRERPALAQKRKLTLELTLTPVPTERGELASVDVQFSIKARGPAAQSAVYSMRSTPDGLMYQELSREDPDQMTFDLELEDTDAS